MDWYCRIILLCLLLYTHTHTHPFYPLFFPILPSHVSLNPTPFPPIFSSLQYSPKLHSTPPPLPPLISPPPFHPLPLHPFPHPTSSCHLTSHIPSPPSPPSQQVCSESSSKDLSTKLHNMSAMFGLYYKRDGRYNKGSEMWASGLCRYLHDAYPALTTQVLKLLTEVCPCIHGYGSYIYTVCVHACVHVCWLVLCDKLYS